MCCDQYYLLHWEILRKLTLNYIKLLKKPHWLRKWVLQWGHSLIYFIYICLGRGYQAFRDTPKLWVLFCFWSSNSFLDVLGSFKNFIGMCVATDNQTNVLLFAKAPNGMQNDQVKGPRPWYPNLSIPDGEPTSNITKAIISEWHEYLKFWPIFSMQLTAWSKVGEVDKVNLYIRSHKMEAAPMAQPKSQIYTQLTLYTYEENLTITDHNPSN